MNSIPQARGLGCRQLYSFKMALQVGKTNPSPNRHFHSSCLPRGSVKGQLRM